MKKIYCSFIIGLLMILLYPTISLAVDFSITDMKIEAFLQENGDAHIVEAHTYSFEGKFNGISRSLYPKKGTEIIDVEATEDGRLLSIEKDEHLYKIHRKGKDETITIEITYTIKNAVDTYQDVAQFYWAFFDDRNESPYENANILIHPPKSTKEVIAFGYDEAFNTENMEQDGSVHFQLGRVPDEENADIRVAYEASLFPDAGLTENILMKDKILEAEQKLHEKAVKRAERKELFSKIALFVVPIFFMFLLVFLVVAYMKARLKKLDVERHSEQTFFTPEEKLSLPATIYFIKGIMPQEAMGAALLDLVRKGYVQQVGTDHFKLKKTAQTLFKHEEILIPFLFEKVGSSGEFRFPDLEEYTKNTKNHTEYQSTQTKWQQAVIEETKDKGLFEMSGKVRWSLGFISLILVPFTIFFGIYELIGWMLATIFLFGAYLILAIAYKPRTWQGHMIVHEWQLVKERLKTLSTNEWGELTDDEQMRIYLFGLGTNDKAILKKNEELVQAFRTPRDPSAASMNAILLAGPMASSSFHSAHSTVSESTSSSSSSSGGGVGGGGGGSGAF